MDLTAEFAALLNQVDSAITQSPWGGQFSQDFGGNSSNKVYLASHPNLALTLANIFGIAVSRELERILSVSVQ